MKIYKRPLVTSDCKTSKDNSNTFKILRDTYQKNGFVKAEKIVPYSLLKDIESHINLNKNHLNHDFPDFLKRFSYDLDPSINEKIFQLVALPAVRQVLTELSQKKLFLSQTLFFELQKNQSIGFPWHVGTYSFGLHQISDYGCTLWIPFVNIKPNDGGGVSCVPTQILSGHFVYEHIEPAILCELERRLNSGESLNYTDYLDLKNRPLNTGYISELIENNSTSYDYQLGDALFFDKYVIHRSDPILDQGPDFRGALVLRFMEAGSTYSEKCDKMRHYPVSKFGSKPFSILKSDLLKEGQTLMTSGLFDSIEKRIIYG